LNKKRSTLTP